MSDENMRNYENEPENNIQENENVKEFVLVNESAFDENGKKENIEETVEASKSENDEKNINEQEIPVFTKATPVVKKKKSNTVLKVIACALVFGIVAGSVGALSNVVVTKFANSRIKIDSTQNYLTKSTDESDISSPIADIADQCMPSIVSITNKGVTEIMTFFGKYAQESTSSGSGIIIGKNDSEILIVTNYHVVADSKELSVLFSDPDDENESAGIDIDDPESTKGDIFQAQIKGYDSDKDLAVISIKLSDVPSEKLAKIKVASIGDSSKVRAGERVVAIGNALGYGQSVTTGIISATERSVTLESQTTAGATVTNKFIQTDAAINPGNSGGALLNMKGELIGINSVKISASGVEGMGYAIPISDVEDIIGELMVIETREVVDEDEQGFLGISGRDVTNETSEAFGMPVGVYVTEVTEGMAADKAGIKKGHIITKFDNHTIRSIAQLQERLTFYKEGETKKITVQVYNGEEYEERELDITLGSKKKDSQKMLEEQQKQQQEEQQENNSGSVIPFFGE